MSATLPTPDKRFIFNGSAVAFGARIRRPTGITIDSAAPSHIPVSGGQSSAALDSPDFVKKFHYPGLITFDTAKSSTSGDFLNQAMAAEFTKDNHGKNDLPTTTSVAASLTNLVINQVNPADPSANRTFIASALSVTMTTMSNRRDPVSFNSLHADFGTLTLKSGDTVLGEILVDKDTDMFCRHDTMAKLINAYEHESDFRKTYAHMLLPLGEEDKTGIAGMVSKHEITYANSGLFVATIVKKLHWKDGKEPKGTKILGNRLTIDGFGRIFFGEVVIQANNRRVTLLRFELGSPDGGDGTACDVGSNGGGYPPGS